MPTQIVLHDTTGEKVGAVVVDSAVVVAEEGGPETPLVSKAGEGEDEIAAEPQDGLAKPLEVERNETMAGELETPVVEQKEVTDPTPVLPPPGLSHAGAIAAAEASPAGAGTDMAARVMSLAESIAQADLAKVQRETSCPEDAEQAIDPGSAKKSGDPSPFHESSSDADPEDEEQAIDPGSAKKSGDPSPFDESSSDANPEDEQEQAIDPPAVPEDAGEVTNEPVAADDEPEDKDDASVEQPVSPIEYSESEPETEWVDNTVPVEQPDPASAKVVVIPTDDESQSGDDSAAEQKLLANLEEDDVSVIDIEQENNKAVMAGQQAQISSLEHQEQIGHEIDAAGVIVPWRFIKSHNPKDLNAWHGTMSKQVSNFFTPPEIYTLSRVRMFMYPEAERRGSTMNRPNVPPFTLVDIEDIEATDDPFEEFDRCEHDLQSEKETMYRFPVGRMQREEVEEYLDHETKYLRLDYLTFYMNWSQRFTNSYDDDRDYFPLYFASGEGTTIFNWFAKTYTGIDDSDLAVHRSVDYIWKRIHPPSYYMFWDRKVLAFDPPKECSYNTPSYRKMRTTLGKLPHRFSILKKRIIGIVLGDGMHFLSYLVVNFGAHFQDGEQSKNPSFIADVDSFRSDHKDMREFVYWLLGVIYELEIWIGQFQNTLAEGIIRNPDLVLIGRTALENAKKQLGVVSTIPVKHLRDCPQQRDTWNCGVFAVLNQRACYLADIHHRIYWPNIKKPRDLWTEVLQHFWRLPTDPEEEHAFLGKCQQHFRQQLLTLLLENSYGKTNIVGKRDDPVEIDDGSKHFISAKEALISAYPIESSSSGDESEEVLKNRLDKRDDEAINPPRSTGNHGSVVASKASKVSADSSHPLSQSGSTKHQPPLPRSVQVRDDADAEISVLEEGSQVGTGTTVKKRKTLHPPITPRIIEKKPRAAASLPIHRKTLRKGFNSQGESDSDSSEMELDAKYEYLDDTRDGRFFEDLKNKDITAVARARKRRERFANWRNQAAHMSFKDSQVFFKMKKDKREARILERARNVKQRRNRNRPLKRGNLP